jgi:hypothetical protein
MPILSAELLSSFYAISLNGKTYILDSWNENLQQDVNSKSFIQGDIANRVVEVSNPVHQATMSGPILLLKDLDSELKVVDNAYINVTDANKNLPPYGIYDIFDLILENLSLVSRPVNELTDLPYFIDNASLSLNFSEVMSTVTLNSIYPQGFERTQTLGFSKSTAGKSFQEARILGRTVKFWDFRFRIFGDFYALTQANINISVVSDRKTYVGNNYYNGNTNPDYVITGYSISGDAVISIPPFQFENFRLYQAPGSFNVFQNSIGMGLIDSYRGHRFIDFGNYLILPRIELDMKSSQMITARISFNTFVRRTF